MHDEVKPLMLLAFSGDADLLQSLTPVVNDNLGNCVDRCYRNVEEMFTGAVYADSQKVAYKIALKEGGELKDIGFMITAKTADYPNELYSFGINIDYRTKDNVITWLKETERILGKYFWVSLYKQNTRAIHFFERNGFAKFVDETQHFVTLCSNFEEYKNNRVCQ